MKMNLFYGLLLFLVTLMRHYVSTSTVHVCVFNNGSKADGTPSGVLCTHKCWNLSQALENYCNTSDVSYLLQPGIHDLFPINVNFSSVKDINIASMSRDKEATIMCQPRSGLVFFNSTNISLFDITLVDCGLPKDTESLNVSLCFLQCSDITIDTVTITNSTGAALYASHALGANAIVNSSFLYNKPFHGKVGGAVVITYYREALSVSNNTWIIKNSSFNWNSANSDESNIKRMVYPNDLHYGRGGGLIVALMGTDTSVSVESCIFKENKALYGGGAFIALDNGSKNNSITFKNTSFIGNMAVQGGGGARVSFLNSSIERNQITFNDCHFLGNRASMLGGGVSFFTTNVQVDTNDLIFNGCTWDSNTANTGSAIGMTTWITTSIGTVPKPRFINCNFCKNSASAYVVPEGHESIIGVVYLDSVSIVLDTVNFTENYATAIFAVGARLQFTGRALFYKNSGSNGGAIALIANAAVIVGEGSFFNFTENRASVHGGAIYAFITSQHYDIVSINCFIRYHRPETEPDNWNTSFYFHDNNVKTRKETIFATTMDHCAWVKDESDKKRFIFCTSDSIWNFTDSNCEDEITTLPADILVPPNLSVFPGVSTSMNLMANDDLRKTVNSYVMTVVNSTNIKIDEDYRFISDDRIKLLHAGSNSSSNASVTLQSIFPRTLQVSIPIDFKECPPAYMYSQSSGQCECNEHSFRGVIRCQPSNFSALIRKGYWIGKYGDNEIVAIGQCRFCQASQNWTQGGFVLLPRTYEELDYVLCGGEKSGTLCTNCTGNKSVALTATGYGCMDCSKKSTEYTWILFILTQLLPITILFFILLVTNFPLASGYLNGAIFFAQTITTSLDISGNGEVPMKNIGNDTELLMEIYDVLYNIWNLDFIEPVQYCLAKNLSMNIIFLIEYLVAFFPLLFVFLIFFFHYIDRRTTFCVKLGRWLCCFRPTYLCYDKIRNKWNEYILGFGQFRQEKALKNILASCILLAYTRCALNTCYILCPAYLYGDNSRHLVTVPFFDASTKYGHGADHLVSIVIALLVALFLLAPIPLALFFGRYKENDISYFNILLEAFQKEFKNGQDIDPPWWSERYPRISKLLVYFLVDMRWVSSLYFLLRLAMILAYILSHTFIVQVLSQQVLACIMIGVIVSFRPYRKSIHNQIDVCIFLLIIVIQSITLYQYSLSISMENLSLAAFIIQYLLVYVPMVWIALHIVWQSIKFCRRVKRNKRNYQEISNVTAENTSVQGYDST